MLGGIVLKLQGVEDRVLSELCEIVYDERKMLWTLSTLGPLHVSGGMVVGKFWATEMHGVLASIQPTKRTPRRVRVINMRISFYPQLSIFSSSSSF